jgi:hypothetical protein
LPPGQDLPNGDVRQLNPAHGERPADLPRRQPLAGELADAAQYRLLLGHGLQPLVVVIDEPERRPPAQVFPARLLRLLGRPDPLPDPVPLERGKGGDDGQEQPRDAVARSSR